MRHSMINEPDGGPGPVVLDAHGVLADPELAAEFAGSTHRILADLVGAGAALGWVDPPCRDEVAELVERVLAAATSGDGALRAAYAGRTLIGLGYWLRHTRPTSRPHADLEKLAVAATAHRRGTGRTLTTALLADARAAGIEVLTLDARADNAHALRLYRSLGFREYGRLPDFVAIGERRWDKVFYMLDFRAEPSGATASDAGPVAGHA
ncbi:GNAT family N-acetyltransferase [Streptomyces noursei]|uniref:GNAT family N-acetyltransferase n=1 Tax=Streptomyces noursei TaxID=1971 RepID=UPI001F042435|nr:N-acetyltransferase [Streptomyces noursei]